MNDQINNLNDNKNNNNIDQKSIPPLKPKTTTTMIRILDTDIISSTNINKNNSNKLRYTMSLNMFADLS
jgi:hypothetical protein